MSDLPKRVQIGEEGPREGFQSEKKSIPVADKVRLIEALAETGATLWVTLSYDGRMAWDPAHPLDRAVAAAFNAHQRSDKGFGPALGPDGIGQLEALLRRRSMMVQTAASDWRLGPEDGPLVRALVDGIAAAVLETGQVTAADIAGWHAFRRAAAGTAVIGHRDLFAYSATMG